MSREKLGSRLGFILLSAGCAIGIGNVWKFPYIVGQNGGGLFVIIYLVFLAILGIPVLTMEFSVGRAAQCSPVKMYQQIEPKGSKWHYHGVAAMIGSYILLMFYTTVAGWMLRYFFSTAGGALADLDAAGISEHFDSVLADPLTMILFVAIVLAAAVLICSIGLKNGLERVTKVMMLALLVIMVILAINSFFMEGGGACILSQAKHRRNTESRHWKRYCKRDESGVLYAQPRNGRNGHFRKLHRQGQIAARGVCERCAAGYVRCVFVRAYHLSGMLCVWR